LNVSKIEETKTQFAINVRMANCY